MGFPGSLGDQLVRDCVIGYTEEFSGFGKYRPVTLKKKDSQKKNAACDKVALYMDFSGCGLKVEHLRTLMRCLASDVKCDLRIRSLPDELAKARKAEIGDELRNSDDFIRQM